MSAAERVAVILERWESEGWNPRPATEEEWLSPPWSDECDEWPTDLYTEERDR